MKKILVLLMVLAFNLLNAQTFQHKMLGLTTIYKCGDTLMTITSSNPKYKGATFKVISTQHVDASGKKMYTYYANSLSPTGFRHKYTFVQQRNDRYTLFLIAIEDFTNEVSKYTLRIKQIK